MALADVFSPLSLRKWVLENIFGVREKSLEQRKLEESERWEPIYEKWDALILAYSESAELAYEIAAQNLAQALSYPDDFYGLTPEQLKAKCWFYVQERFAADRKDLLNIAYISDFAQNAPDYDL